MKFVTLMVWYAVAMATFDLVDTTRKYLAVIVIGGSTLRGQTKGTIASVRGSLGRVDLHAVPKASANDYQRWLDGETTRILDDIADSKRPWGTARKALNLFMRACISDHHVRAHFDLAAVERFAEMPLDSVSASALKSLAGRGALPMWPGLRGLTQADSERFQRFAAQYAVKIGASSRIYVDYALWLDNRDK